MSAVRLGVVRTSRCHADQPSRLSRWGHGRAMTRQAAFASTPRRSDDAGAENRDVERVHRIAPLKRIGVVKRNVASALMYAEPRM